MITHLRKVSKKRGKTAHLRKVEEGGWKRKRAYRHYRGSRANCAPSEGEQKTRGNCTPSEGEQKTWLYPPDQTRYLLSRPDIVTLGDVDDAAEGVGYHEDGILHIAKGELQLAAHRT